MGRPEGGLKGPGGTFAAAILGPWNVGGLRLGVRGAGQPCWSRSRCCIAGAEAMGPSIDSSGWNSKAGSQASWRYEGTREATGWFEVSVGGKLVHSKKNGDGFVDDNDKLDKIFTAIKQALA